MTTRGGAPRPARTLFWAQVGLGVLIGGGTVVGLGVLAGAGPAGALVGLLLLAWVAAGLAALWWVERRKPLVEPAPQPPEWARRVAELRSSRREIVGAFEIERRRIERDLHDGAQQHLVTASMKLGEAAHVIARIEPRTPDLDIAGQLLGAAQDDADRALAALRETVSGVHPTVLTDRGLEAAVRDLAARSPLVVTVRVPHPLPDLPEGVAAVAYFLVAEALTNVAKHAPGASVTVLLVADESLHVSVVDDGPGGATPTPGRGLSGMAERLAAVGSTLVVTSPPGGPTTVVARLPLLLDAGEWGIVVGGREEGR